MKRIRILWQIYSYYVLIIIVSLVAVLWYSTHSVKDIYLEKTTSDLLARAKFAELFIRDDIEELNYDEVEQICEKLGDATETRVTVILPSGKVVADSHEDPFSMDDHSTRPEVVRSMLPGETYAASIRYSNTLNKKMLYVAYPLMDGHNVMGIIRTAFSIESIDQVIGWMYLRILAVGAGIMVLAALVSLAVSKKVTEPLEKMKKGAERFAQGDLKHQLTAPKSQEIAAVVDSMNKMAYQLDERIKTVLRQKNELDTVLSSMTEGVIAVDNDQRFIILNQAASQLISSENEIQKGKKLQETVRNRELLDFVEKALKTDQTIETQISFLIDKQEKCLQLHGTALQDDKGRKIGALVVLNDVTMMRRLEKVRTDFVANVSHELKTPVTSIKGFVETLLDGAMNDPEDAKRFLRIIDRQSNRLHAIIDDLLILSKLEQQQSDEISFQSTKINKVLSDAVQLCEIKRKQKDIEVEVNCDNSLRANINGPLIEQAMVNLLDNAIKYSDEGSDIQLSAQRLNGHIVIKVRDHGQGIESNLLPRLFERFYRVDKARSRNMGGTGLGLSIVKHIVQVHKGSVNVESELGKGSTFTLELPVAEQN